MTGNRIHVVLTMVPVLFGPRRARPPRSKMEQMGTRDKWVRAGRWESRGFGSERVEGKNANGYVGLH